MTKTTAFANLPNYHDEEKAEVSHKEYDSSLAATASNATDAHHPPAEGDAWRKEHKKAVRKLLFKLDICILPFALALYLSAYLDRGNMANARLQGLEKSILNNDDTNYSIALCCFFITYILMSVPGTLLAKRFNPSYAIGAGAMIWSIAALCQGVCHNRAQLFVCRLFIGIGEGCFGQGMGFHLSLWYTKKDLAKRIGLFISAGALSGAFGGLIAYGVSSIKNASIPQWRILFFIEGAPSVVLAILVVLFMPGRPETSKYLSEDERTLLLTRMNAENSVDSRPGIDWRGVRRAFVDPKTYIISTAYSCLNMSTASVGGFLPTIIKGLGYAHGSDARAQLFTVPPYAVALVFMLLMTSFSDAKQTRGIPSLSVFLIGLVGWVLLLKLPASESSESELAGRYFACCCIVVASYTNIPIIMSWVASNCGNQSQRAASMGMLNTLGQALSLAAAFLFPTAEKPQYTKGCKVNVAFACFGAVLVSSMTFWLRRENARRDKVEGGPPAPGAIVNTNDEFDLAPGFRYTV